MHGRRRGNQKGPQNAFLSALAAFKASGKKLPVNLVLVCEGEEEITSPRFGEIVNEPGVLPYVRSSIGVMLPNAAQEPRRGASRWRLGAKGVVELELGIERREVGPRARRRISIRAWKQQVDSTLVAPGAGAQHAGGKGRARAGGGGLLRQCQTPSLRAQTTNGGGPTPRHVPEATIEDHVWEWITGCTMRIGETSLPAPRIRSPTINIEGLVGGYTGPGGKTVLPHRAVAKIDMRLVPDMTAVDTLAKLKAHLAKHGFERHRGQHDRRLRSDADRSNSKPSRPLVATFTKLGETPLVVPRSPRGLGPAMDSPGRRLIFPPARFGLGHGTGAHAPDEYFLINPRTRRSQGLDGAIGSFVEFLYAVA